jgi:hypothetical protein
MREPRYPLLRVVIRCGAAPLSGAASASVGYVVGVWVEQGSIEREQLPRWAQPPGEGGEGAVFGVERPVPPVPRPSTRGPETGVSRRPVSPREGPGPRTQTVVSLWGC